MHPSTTRPYLHPTLLLALASACTFEIPAGDGEPQPVAHLSRVRGSDATCPTGWRHVGSSWLPDGTRGGNSGEVCLAPEAGTVIYLDTRCPAGSEHLGEWGPGRACRLAGRTRSGVVWEGAAPAWNSPDPTDANCGGDGWSVGGFRKRGDGMLDVDCLAPEGLETLVITRGPGGDARCPDGWDLHMVTGQSTRICTKRDAGTVVYRSARIGRVRLRADDARVACPDNWTHLGWAEDGWGLPDEPLPAVHACEAPGRGTSYRVKYVEDGDPQQQGCEDGGYLFGGLGDHTVCWEPAE